MGDRVLFQVHSTDQLEVSPVIYGHWSGSNAPDICANIQARMKGREGDVPYTAARIVQEVCDTVNDKQLSVGIWNSETLLTAKDSHGDAGVVLVEAANGGLKFKCIGGYLRVSSDGTVRDPEGKL